ncbi:MAG TPA: LPXTG cell wall anchor domain-containing protein [Solirubrobacterales bacterium]|nr:LPXTG cell wall anchor domain-containing protein [Solirubrobacterales bacterium]
MKSRLAMMLVIAAGFMLSTTGAGLAISGSSSSGSAAESQYTPAGVEEHGGHHSENQGVKGAATKGGNKCSENGNGNGTNGGGGNSGNSGANGSNCNEPAETEPAPAEVEVAPVPAEQQAVVSSGSSLPFTGFVAIPLLIIGVLMVVGGAMLRFKSRKEHTA